MPDLSEAAKAMLTVSGRGPFSQHGRPVIDCAVSGKRCALHWIYSESHHLRPAFKAVPARSEPKAQAPARPGFEDVILF